jgi:hypothetical protein
MHDVVALGCAESTCFRRDAGDGRRHAVARDSEVSRSLDAELEAKAAMMGSQGEEEMETGGTPRVRWRHGDGPMVVLLASW